MSLRALRTLVAIAQHGSFVRAAEAVFLTQSAVSLQVRQLEREFNAALFDRSHRVPTLTDAGKIVLERAHEILALYDGLHTELVESEKLSGRLRLGAIRSIFADILPTALAQLQAKHPKLRILVSSGLSAELAVRLTNDELDAAITTEPVKPHPPDLFSTPLYREDYWIVAPREAANKDARRILQEYPMIRFQQHSWAGRTIARELRKQKLKFDIGMELDDIEAIVQMVSKGLGAGIVPLFTSQQAIGQGLTCLPFGSPQRHRKVVILERAGRPSLQFAQAVAHEIQDCVERHVAQRDAAP
ncbi:LysR family transcriptional regulator [Bordetella genomosp. 10]|uniref:LysR family transcriptional regulator n=1 Tax=Bordetella genomosp. 10 TaxID=1416804 RepID=A0A261SMP7_9BORD|nr:LysR substrate-binding domain-containing protein [Bordetella genomosp. 10]OZI38361.1 LysR family transcriptional regulator [Bordetella genomosp. 10]